MDNILHLNCASEKKKQPRHCLLWVWSCRAQRDLQQSGNDVGVCGVKGQTIHLHCEVTSFPTSYPKIHQSGEDGLFLER